jgi:adenosylmethionine-8-amino-7-oxononanoate aminotransferase
MTLSERDQKYLWHPYTQHKTAALLLQLKGEGALFWDENDKEYIDAIASWVNPMGTVINLLPMHLQAINYFRACTFGGFTHEPDCFEKS